MSTIVTRAVKGSALSFTEMDSNFGNLNTDKLENITAENIGDLSDVVQTGTPADNELLAYDTGTSKWINQTAVEAGLAGLTSFSVTTGSPSGAAALSYDDTTGVFTFQPADLSLLPFIETIDEDTTPQLGGNLDVLTNEITTSIANGDIVIRPIGSGTVKAFGALDTVSGTLTTSTTNGHLDLSANGTGLVRVGQAITHINTDADLNLDSNGTGNINLNGPVNIEDLLSFAETIDILGGVSGTLSINAADGPIKLVVPSGAMTINGFASPVSGQTVTLLVDNASSGTNYGITLGAGLLTPAGGGVTVTDSGYDLVTITCVDSVGGLYVVTAINDFQ